MYSNLFLYIYEIILVFNTQLGEIQFKKSFSVFAYSNEIFENTLNACILFLKFCNQRRYPKVKLSGYYYLTVNFIYLHNNTIDVILMLGLLYEAHIFYIYTNEKNGIKSTTFNRRNRLYRKKVFYLYILVILYICV